MNLVDCGMLKMLEPFHQFRKGAAAPACMCVWHFVSDSHSPPCSFPSCVLPPSLLPSSVSPLDPASSLCFSLVLFFSFFFLLHLLFSLLATVGYHHQHHNAAASFSIPTPRKAVYDHVHKLQKDRRKLVPSNDVRAVTEIMLRSANIGKL